MSEKNDNPSKKTAPVDVIAVKRSKAPIVLLIVAIFIGIVAIKVVSDSGATDGATAGSPSQAASITSVHNDAVADFEAAQASGRPIYVLFHSLSCIPCVEISAVADQVLPDYEGEVVFVNAITEDPAGQELAANFSFQYIPTSFFLSPGGSDVVDSYTGAMDEPQMRASLDKLVDAQ